MSNLVSKIAIVGAGGNLGSFITAALLATGKHTITALTRHDSKNQLPEGIIAKTVNYDQHESLVAALRGQEVLIITLNGAAVGAEHLLVKAAAEASVPWILPNEWSPDSANEELVKDVPMFRSKGETRRLIRALGKSSCVSLVTGFWYEWSLAQPYSFGIDFKNRKATFFDEGETPISVSTWPQIGRAVASLLSLPIRSESGACLELYRNEVVYINSFTLNQKAMLASAVRVTDTKMSDWTVSKESARGRYEDGQQLVKDGTRLGYAKIMYTRVFFDDGCGDFEHRKGTLNEVLGLPKEQADEMTKVALLRSELPSWADKK